MFVHGKMLSADLEDNTNNFFEFYATLDNSQPKKKDTH